MKGAALFFVDALVKDPKTGFLYTGPSNSPEQGGLVMGPTMDREIVRTLFGETIAAAKALNVDADLRDQLAGMRKQIAPLQIGQHGQLQEWMEDTDDPKNQHRHVSHLWAVYPGSEITPYGTPDLFKAAQQSLDLPRRRRHRLVDGLEAEPVGALPGWRPRLQDHAEPDHPGVGRQARPRPASSRTCSTRIRRSRSTATSAPPPASPRCCCKATTPTARPPA